MKKIVFFTGIILLFCNNELFAQGNQLDAYTLSTSELNGTSRSMAMAGAFGALGGDVSVISSNPAGLGIYRSSEISGTLDLSVAQTSTDWINRVTNQSKTRFSPNNFAFELFFPTMSGGIENWNIGFSYNRVKNFNRRYTMSTNAHAYSMADYSAWRASNAFGIGDGILPEEFERSPYMNAGLSGEWLPILGYEAGFFGDIFEKENGLYHSAFGNWDGDNWNILSPKYSHLAVNESGYMNEYNFGFGVNLSNFMYLGASMSVMDLDYKYASFYQDRFESGRTRDDDLFLENWLNTEGSAFSINVGVITNLEMLRLGVAYNSPRWYKMTDYYDAQAGSYATGYAQPEAFSAIPEASSSEYNFRTPGKWIFSGAVILGQSALISADYEISNYNEMLFSHDYNFSSYSNVDYIVNDYIKADFTWAHTLKLGGEIKINPQFAIRAGYMMQTSPMRKDLVENYVEVYPAGTIPHFNTTSMPTNYYTVGLGYRFTPNFYMDAACVYRYNNSKAYAFSNTDMYRSNEEAVISIPASLKSKTTRVLLTMGYKF